MRSNSLPFPQNQHTTRQPLQKSLPWSLYYMVRDFAALFGLYYAYPQVQAYGVPGLFVWWNLAGAFCGVGCFGV